MNRTSAGAGCRHAADLPLVQSQRPASERRERTHPWLGVAALAVVVIVWSASNVVAKTVSSTGIFVSFYRLWFALPAVWIPVLLSTNWRTRLDRDWLSASLVGGTLFALHQFLFFTSLKLTSVANVTVIGALQPILVLLVADRLFEERAHAGAWLWSGVAFAGTAAVVFGSSHGLGWSWKGDVLATLNLFAFTAYFLASKHIRPRLGYRPEPPLAAWNRLACPPLDCMVPGNGWACPLQLGPPTCICVRDVRNVLGGSCSCECCRLRLAWRTPDVVPCTGWHVGFPGHLRSGAQATATAVRPPVALTQRSQRETFVGRQTRFVRGVSRHDRDS